MKKVPKVIPVAERITKFKERDLTYEPLTIMEGWNILHYKKEIPIVHYKCDEVECVYLEGGFRLNSFIETITVSSALNGQQAGFGSGELNSEKTDYGTVVYYTDHEGINHAIIQYDIYNFLLQKPKLVVSPEGVLVFFTDEQIIATVDCNHYHWIDGHIIDVEGKTIENIEVCDDYCKVILLDDRKAEQCFCLTFDFDVTSRQILKPKASKL